MRFSRVSVCGVLVWSAVILGGCSLDNGPTGQSVSPDTQTRTSDTEQTPEFEGLMAHAQRAREAEARQDWSTARDEYQKALVQEPRHPIVLLRLARYEAKLGQAEEAIQHLNGVADLGATADLSRDLFFDDLRAREDFQVANERLAQNGIPHEAAQLIHTFADAELWPEGIATDAATGNIYVGSFNRKKVVRVLPDGTVEDFGTTVSDNLQSVVGVWVDSERRELWAATGNQATPGSTLEPGEVVRYDVETGELRARYVGPDDGQPQLINDVTVAPDARPTSPRVWADASFG